MFLEASSFLLRHLGLNSQFHALLPPPLFAFIATLLPIVVYSVLIMIVLQIVVYILFNLELIMSELHLPLKFDSCSNLSVEFKRLRIVILHPIFHFKKRSAVVVTTRELFQLFIL